MELTDVEAELLEVIRSFSGRLPEEQLDEMSELARAGELGVAFENLCTQVFEYHASVSPAIVCSLERMGISMNLDSEYWTQLDVKPSRRTT